VLSLPAQLAWCFLVETFADYAAPGQGLVSQKWLLKRTPC